MLQGIDLAAANVTSIHEPCPAVISETELKTRDLLISSPDEERRMEGVNSIKRSIDLAVEIGCHNIVVHCGQIQVEDPIENRLRSLFNEGGRDSDEYKELFDAFLVQRASLIGPYFGAVKKSLTELLDYAWSHRVRLGIENRYHFLDIPSLDEMGEILDMADPDRLGFIYDMGHAQTLDRLGFFLHETWLQRYTGRMIGMHLHDVLGIHDHLAPGWGEIDYKKIAPYLPKSAFRTLEVTAANTPERIREGLRILEQSGCVSLVE
jgi:sugar phosphate isomerase/epimerase